MPYESHVLRRAVHKLLGRSVGSAVSAALRLLASLATAAFNMFRSITIGRHDIKIWTTFVNAAVMSSDGTRIVNAALVVDL